MDNEKQFITEIANNLGQDWSCEVSEHQRLYLTHNSGAKISFFHDVYRKKYKFWIWFPVRPCYGGSSGRAEDYRIDCTEVFSCGELIPEKIAKRIKTNFLDDNYLENYEKALKIIDEDNQKQKRKNDALASILNLDNVEKYTEDKFYVGTKLNGLVFSSDDIYLSLESLTLEQTKQIIDLYNSWEG